MNNNLLGNYISFETFLKNYISEHGERIEDYRKRILKKITLLKITAILLPILSLILTILSVVIGVKLDSYILALIFFMIFMAIYALSCKYGTVFYKNYCNEKINEYKNYVQKYLKIDNILDYMGIRHLNRFSDESTNLLNLAKNCDFVNQFSTTEICFCVNYLDKECIVSDIITRSSDSKELHTLVVKFDFNKNIKTDVFINNSNGTEKNIPFEFEKFNKEFKIYSADEIESRYLITTSFMERLLSAKKAFRFSNFEAAFLSKENVFILSGSVNNFSDVFEVSDVNRSVYDLSIYSQFFFEIHTIKKIAEYLKLNLDIGL